jgi:hypothetical protein
MGCTMKRYASILFDTIILLPILAVILHADLGMLLAKWAQDVVAHSNGIVVAWLLLIGIITSRCIDLYILWRSK